MGKKRDPSNFPPRRSPRRRMSIAPIDEYVADPLRQRRAKNAVNGRRDAKPNVPKARTIPFVLPVGIPESTRKMVQRTVEGPDLTPEEDKLASEDPDVVHRACHAVLDMTDGSPSKTARVVDALSSSKKVAKSSSHMQKRAKKAAAQSKQRKRKSAIQRDLVSEQHNEQRSRAWLTFYSLPEVSSKSIDKLRMGLSYEMRSEAAAKITDAPTTRSMAMDATFSKWNKAENKADLELIVTRLIEYLDSLAPQWRTSTAADFNYDSMVDGGWSGMGLDHDIDTFLGDIEACSSVTRTKRGYFLKEALRASGKAPQAFFATSSTRVRRGFNRSGFSAITPTLQSRAKEQMEYTEQHSYQTLTVDGFVFHTPSEHSKSNPTSSFLGEVVHATPTRSRVLEDLGRLHNSGDLVLQRRSVFAQHGRDRLFAELRKANYPEASISELESLPTPELRDVVYKSLNTIHLGYYFDHAALLETWPTAICYARIMYLDRQWNPATELSHKKKLLQNLMRPTIDLFGRGHSSQEETNDLLTLVTSEFWPTDGYFLQPPSPSLSMEDVANLTAPPTDIEEAAIGDGSSDVEVWFKSKFSIGDIEQHLTNMGQQGSGGMYSSPHRYGSQEELVIPAACLLLDSRVLGDHIDLFGGGPGGNSKGTFNTDSGVKMAEWRRQYCLRFSSDTPADGKIVVAAVKKDLQGVVMRSGVAPPASKGSAADFEALPDPMHNIAGHIHHCYDVMKAQLPADDRRKLVKALKEANVYLPKMRCRDWVFLALFLNSPPEDLGGVHLPIPQVVHLFCVVEMRRLMYRPLHLGRSRGLVLSVVCVVIKLVVHLEDGFPRDGRFPKSGATMNALYGKYLSGIVFLAATTRVIEPVQGCCESGERAFQVPKRVVNHSCNNHWKDTVPVTRRSLLAVEVNNLTNRSPSDFHDDDEKHSKLYDELHLGPRGMGGSNGELRHFTAQEVRHPFFVVACLKLIPDYISSGEWWTDDATPFVDSVRATTFSCDFTLTTGAELFDFGSATLKDLDRLLLVYSGKVLNSENEVTLPGWESLALALSFLKGKAAECEVLQRRLTTFLRKVGCD